MQPAIPAETPSTSCVRGADHPWIKTARGLRWPSMSGWLLLGVLSLQFPLWFGQGGWIQVWKMQSDHDERLERIAAQRAEIQELEAEVRDLQTGLVAAEERAPL